jgi:hypothetical protein
MRCLLTGCPILKGRVVGGLRDSRIPILGGTLGARGAAWAHASAGCAQRNFIAGNRIKILGARGARTGGKLCVIACGEGPETAARRDALGVRWRSGAENRIPCSVCPASRVLLIKVGFSNPAGSTRAPGAWCGAPQQVPELLMALPRGRRARSAALAPHSVEITRRDGAHGHGRKHGPPNMTACWRESGTA